MTNQQSINVILSSALQKIREQHGLAARTIRVEWLDTVDRPAIAITSIEVEGSVNDAPAQERAEGELPQGYAERPFDYSGDLYTEGQMRAIIKDNRDLVAERDALRDALETMVEMVEMNGFGRAYAMKVARAALGQGQGGGDAPEA